MSKISQKRLEKGFEFELKDWYEFGENYEVLYEKKINEYTKLFVVKVENERRPYKNNSISIENARVFYVPTNGSFQISIDSQEEFILGRFKLSNLLNKVLANFDKDIQK